MRDTRKLHGTRKSLRLPPPEALCALNARIIEQLRAFNILKGHTLTDFQILILIH